MQKLLGKVQRPSILTNKYYVYCAYKNRGKCYMDESKCHGQR